jgi:hypothetical protein
MNGARLVGTDALPEQFASVIAEWVDFSTHTSEVKVKGAEIQAHLAKARSAAFAPVPTTAADQTKRFFGKGDILRNASLEFGEQSLVEIESRFERCTIALQSGARLVIGPNGMLEGCQIRGAGEIVVHGSFEENGQSPGIVGPRRLIVGKDGYVSGAVQQATDLTQFAFERGCVLRLKIRK